MENQYMKKTLYIESLPNKSADRYNHKINNIDLIWVALNNTFIILNDEIKSTTTLPWKHTTNSSIAVYVDEEAIEIVSDLSDRSAWSAYVTIRYTKTTD